MKSFCIRSVLALAVLVFGAGTAVASLESSYTFNGKGNWSIDGVGSNNTPVGTIDVEVPAGSTVVKAFLYSSAYGNAPTPSVGFDGTVYSGADWTALGLTAGIHGLQAWRTDVTSQIAAKVGSGGGTFQFVVDSEVPNSSIDGEVLAVVYSNPAEKERTIGFLDGFSLTTGDQTTVNFASPLEGVGDPEFEAYLSVGIGYSYQPGGQVSEINITGNGERLTSSAGGQDDGDGYNGGLITVGGLGDSTDNPPDPYAPASSVRYDDELYDLEPFISNGDTSFVVDTINPSNNDNIFFMAINITAVAGVNEPPPTGEPPPPPEPVPALSPLMLSLLAGLLLLVGFGAHTRRD